MEQALQCRFIHCDLCFMCRGLCCVCKGELMKQEDVRQEDAIDLGRLLSIVVAKKKVVVCIVAVCTAIAAIVAFALPKEYTSQATVQVVSFDIGGGGKAPAANIVGDIELVRSNEVLGPVVEQAFGDLAPESRPSVDNFAKRVQRTWQKNLWN